MNLCKFSIPFGSWGDPEYEDGFLDIDTPYTIKYSGYNMNKRPVFHIEGNWIIIQERKPLLSYEFNYSEQELKSIIENHLFNNKFEEKLK